MDLDLITGSVDAQTFAVGGAIFVLIEIVKLLWPRVTVSKRGAHALQIATLALGLIAGVVLLRSGGSLAGEDSVVTGLRRGLSAGAVALMSWHLWRVSFRAAWRSLRERFLGSSAKPPAPRS